MMSVNLSIKNASDEVVAALKLRARQNHRSLQGELMAIIEEAAKANGGIAAAQGLREAATASQGRDEAASAQQEARERNIERAVALMKEGTPLGGQRFTREEMHER
jgi:plasmid stability protein